MPLATKPTCIECQTTSSTIWKKNKSGDVVCNSCFTQKPPVKIEKELTPEPETPTTAEVTEPEPLPAGKTRSQTKDLKEGTVGTQFVGPIRKWSRIIT